MNELHSEARLQATRIDTSLSVDFHSYVECEEEDSTKEIANRRQIGTQGHQS